MFSVERRRQQPAPEPRERNDEPVRAKRVVAAHAYRLLQQEFRLTTRPLNGPL